MFTNSEKTAIITLKTVITEVVQKGRAMNINTNNLNLFFSKVVKTVENNAEKSNQGAINHSVMQQQQFVESSIQVNQALIFNKITNAQLKMLINELLNLPKDLQTFLAMFIDSNNLSNLSEKEILTLLNNNLINTEAVKNLLNNNSSDIINKLVKLLSNNMGMQNVDQFKEITALIKASVPSAKASTDETLKNIVLLYLPWLPLDADIKFKIEQRKKKGELSPDEQSYIVINIETKTFGNIRIVIVLDINNLVFKIEAREDFPKDSITKLIKNEFSKFSINTQVSCVPKKEVVEPKQKRNVELSTSGTINPILLLAAHSIIKLIIEADKCNFVEP